MNIHTLDMLFGEQETIRTKNLQAGEFIFHQGESARNIFAIEKGQIRLVRPTFEGRLVTMHLAKEGESFAEAALFAEMYHCNAMAVTDTSIHIYPKEKVLHALRISSDTAEEYIFQLSAQVRALRTKLELRNILSARERILEYFHLYANPNSRELHLIVPLKEIAADLGLAHETFYRELAKLQKDNIIERKENKIILLP